MESINNRFYHILAGAWRQRYLILIPAIILPILGGFIGSTSAKKYSAHTSMLIQETSKLNPFLEQFAVSAMLKERMAALETLIHSRYILTEVAKDLSLINDETQDSDKEAVISMLSSGLSFSSAGKDLIRIDYTSHNANEIKAVLESVSKYFIEQLLAPERSSIKDSEFFLEKNLTERRLDLDKAEHLLAMYKNKNSEDLPELYASNIAQMTKIKEQLSKKQAELDGAVKSLGTINEQLSKTNPVTIKIEEQLVREKSDLALLRSKYTDEHSTIQGALRRIKQLELERNHSLANSSNNVNLDELWSSAFNLSQDDSDGKQPLLISQLEALQNSRNKVDGLTQEVKSLRAMITELELKTKDNGTREQELVKLTRDLEVKKSLYNQILERHEMAKVTGSLGVFEKEKRIKIIDRPFKPARPLNLPALLFIIGGLFGGLALGSGLALVLELSNTTIRNRQRLEQLSGLPVISRIPPLNHG